MRVQIKQIGGIAGQVEWPAVDTSRLGDRGKRIERLVAALGSPPSPPTAAGDADVPRYQITIGDGGASRTIERRDAGGDRDTVRELVAAVTGMDPAETATEAS
ncbi:MAG: hypothetical protein ACJ79H_07650 [Myxococcales bacterium]